MNLFRKLRQKLVKRHICGLIIDDSAAVLDLCRKRAFRLKVIGRSGN